MMTVVRRCAGLWVLSLVIALAAAFVLPASASASSSAPAWSTTPVQMSFACALKSNGLMRYVSSKTQCKTSETLVTIVPGPNFVCVHTNNSVFRVSSLSSCPAPPNKVALTLPPTSSPVFFCAANGSGVLNYTTSPTSCTSGQFPVEVQPVPPVLSNIETTPLQYYAGTPPVTVTSTLTVSSPATGNLVGATVTISSGLVASDDLLGFASQNGITGSYKASTGVLTLSGTSSVANYQAALRSVTYKDSNALTAGGTRTISFQVNDGLPAGNLSNVVSRTINVMTNAAPTCTNVTASTDKNTAINISVLPSCSDADGDTLSVASVGTAGTKGAVSINANGTINYNPKGQFQSLNQGQMATDTFTFTVSDGFQDSAPATVTVTITGLNTVTVTSPGSQTSTVGSAVSLQIQASDSASGQTLTYSATGLPAGLSIASSTGLISGTPTTAATSSVTVTATDTTGASGSATFTWTVNPAANTVTVTNPGNQTSTAGSAVSLQIQASDSASGQTLTYSATGLPAGLSIASSTGLISGTPTTAGTSSVTVTATDTTGASGSATFTWTVNPQAQPPTAVNQSYSAVGNTTLAVGTTATTGPYAAVSGSLLTGDSGDSSCGTLSVTGNTGPPHGTVTVNTNGTFTYLPAAGFTGSDTFQYTITCSSSGLAATATVTITVGPVVWYVDDSQSAAGTGESNAPFNTLAAANSAVGANSIVFLYQGNATYTGGLTMKSGDDLWGQPHGLTAGGYSLVAAGGSNPTITNTSSGGDGIDLASNVDIENVTVSGASGNGVSGSGVTGTVTIANSTVTTAGVNNAIITDTSGTLNLTVTGSTFSNSTASDTNNNSSHGLIINADGSTDATVSVTGSTLTGNTGDEFQFATDSASTGTDSVTFSDNQVSGVGIHGGGGSGALIQPHGNNTTTITMDGNNVQNITDNGLAVDNEGPGTVSGTINANTVGSPTVANSGGSNSISATAEGAGTETLAITSNKLYQYDDFAGIYYIDRQGSPTLNLTITGNTIADPAGNATQGGAWGIYGEAGAATGDAGTVCAAITGNSLTGAGQTSLGSADIELDQNVAGVTYELPGYTGGSTDTSAVQTFVAGNNNSSSGTPSVIATVVGAPGFVGGSSCPAP